MSAQQQIFGAADGGNGAVGDRLRSSVPRPGHPSRASTSSAGPGHESYDLYFLQNVRRGQRECRLETCTKCGNECPHEYVCLQPSNPRVWSMQCTLCRRARRELKE